MYWVAVALVDSLLTAMVRANGDALVMHVGEKPIVVSGSKTIDLSAHGLNFSAMIGMLGQLLPGDAQSSLAEFGAVEHRLPSRGSDHFTVVAARGGDDIWIEIRRRRDEDEFVTGPVAEPTPAPQAREPDPEPAAQASSGSSVPTSVAEPATGEVPGEAQPVEPEIAVATTRAGDHAPVLATEAGSPEEDEAAAEKPDTPIEAIAPRHTDAFRAPQAVPVMATAVAAGHTDKQTPMAPMDFIPPTPAVTDSATAVPSGPTAAPGGGGAAGTEPPATPVTRTVRIEVPSRSGPGRATATDRLLRAASGHGASELFLMSQARPYIRVDGEVRGLDNETPLQAADVESLLADLTPEPWRDAVRRGDPAEWLMEFAEVGRVRCATFRDHRGPGAIFHFTATQVVTADQLGLDPAARLLATEPDGLVVVAGPAGSDKSAIVAAFVDIINRHRGDYVITLEPQVRLIHEHHQALISQREIGTDADRGLAMARAALRESPDVLVLEDVTSGDLVSLALDAASNGRLAIVSVEAGSTADAVQRLIELVPAERRSDARVAMAQGFRGAVAQLLLRKASGGRIAVREVLTGTGAVTRLIAEGTLADLSAALDAGGSAGMAPMADALVGYVQSGVVDVREASRRAPDRARLMASLKAAGVDTAAVDRLA
jgi:twitching motility protein PilT